MQLEEKLPPESRMKKSSVSFCEEQTTGDNKGEPEMVSLATDSQNNIMLCNSN